jgi:hypothetical protein
MKLIVLSFMSIMAIFGIVRVGASTEAPQIKEDREFEQLMSDFNSTMQKNKHIQAKADSTKQKMIIETAKKIVQLSIENTGLKTELNETKAKLDSIATDTSSTYSILAISPNKEN